MADIPLPARACLAFLVVLGALHAQSALPPEPVRLDSLAAFRAPSANWRLAGDLAGDPRHDKTLAATAGTGVLVCNPGTDKATRGHLFTTWEHGDLELELDFLLPPGANSGVYLQGRYEVQLFDSWGVREPSYSDCGGIYERGPKNAGYEGHAPRANACRAPGLWQHLRIEFKAPQFDASGRKTKNARFTKVVLNGFVIHENVEVTGPTRAAAFTDEKPLGPLMIQGDHGPVALRNLSVKRFGRDRITTENLHYAFYRGDFNEVGGYDKQRPKSEGVPEKFAPAAIEKNGKFAVVFTGSVVVPADGTYRFAAQSGSMSRLMIDGRTVIVPIERGSQPGTIALTRGPHEFRLDLVHSRGRPSYELIAEGPGLAPQVLTTRDGEPRAERAKKPGPAPILVEPGERILLQRGFVPFEPRKRLYAASVGTPAGVHYAYDFETGAILRAWRGSFINTTDMWEGRGNDQVARADGPALTFHGKPTIALIEYAQNGDWPDRPDPLWSSQGYVLEAGDQPVFLARLADVTIRDRIAPAAQGRGLERRLELDGKLPSWSAWVLLAEASAITPQPDAHGWIVGEREWYLDWPAGGTRRPVVRTVNGKQQLAVPLTAATLEKPIVYSIVW